MKVWYCIWIAMITAWHLNCSSYRTQDGVVHKANKKLKSIAKRGSPEAFWLARRYHMTKQPTGTFHSHNFRAVMGFILENIRPT